MHLLRCLALLSLCSVWVGCNAKLSSAATPSGRAPIGPGAASTEAAAKTGPVEVTFFAPRGETEGQLEISVSFDRPMVALGTHDAVASDVLLIEPPIAGRARWVGSQILLFEPSAPPPMATEFRVRVAETLRALDGQPLAQALEFTFATPAPKVVRSDPRRGATGELKERALELYFNQRVDPARVKEFGALSYVTASKKQPVSAEFDTELLDDKRVRVRAKKPFPLAAQVSFALRAGMPSAEGPRPLAEDFSTSFEVFGPLRLLANPPCQDDDCMPVVRFSNAVHTRDARKALRFEPALTQPLEDQEDYVSDELYFGEGLAPGTKYRVRVEGPLRDVHGNLLSGERSTTMQTPPFAPYARFLVEGDLVAMGGGRAVPKLRAQFQNLRDARLELTALSPSEVFPALPASSRPRAPRTTQSYGTAGPTERRVVEVDPSGLLANGKGILLATVRGQARDEVVHEDRLLAFTDLAPTLKVSARGGMVWVTRLSNAEPVSGANVRIVRDLETLATGRTDERGMFAFTLAASEEEDEADVAAVVDKDGDVSFARKFGGVGPWELTGHASYRASGATRAHLFTERGIYRPGDTVQLKGILRSESGTTLVPSQGEVSVRVLDASESEVEESTATLNAYGTFAKSVHIPGSVELGPLSLLVTFGDQEFSTSVEVAEYRPAELELSLRADSERALRGQQVAAQVQAQYLFGAPATGARMYWSARYESRSFTAPGLEGFSFEDDDGSHRYGFSQWAADGQAQLGAHGEAGLVVKLDEAPTFGPTRLEIEASVLLESNQAAARTSIDVTPAAVVVGLRAASTVVEAHEPLALQMVALTPQGERKSEVALELTLDRRVYRYEEADGQKQRSQEHVRVGSCRKKSAREPVACTLTPTEPGLHIARVRAKDARGHESVASRWLYVYGSGQAWWDDEPGNLVKLEADRAHYKLGETAKVLVPSPFAAADALVTVERDGVLSAQQLKVGSASTLDIRIDERFVPNAFVSVLLVRPLAGHEGDADFRVGTLELSADISERKLAVTVTPDAAEKRPGDEVDVQLAVHDGTGKPTQAELTVFAVDEGVLRLTDFATPDPFAAIYAARPLAIWTSDARANLARILQGAGYDKGGDEGGGGGAMEMRTNFAAVATFVPSLETDARGKASVHFKLPDSTTRYRIMAVAASRAAQVGSGAGAVRTKKPLMVRPQLPRVLRAGDTLTASAIVHNETDADVDAELTLEASGITLSDAKTQHVKVPAHGSTDARYALRAERVGDAQLTFRARAGKERDAIAISRHVLAPATLQTLAIAGSTQQGAREALAPLQGLRSDVGGLDFALSTSALSELEAPARSLLAYPYGCTEQLSSRLIALAALERLRKPLALADPSFAPVAENLSAELERHQRQDGGFGLWHASDQTSPSLSAYLTSYVLLAYDQLQRAGLPVSPHARDRARQYLASYLRAHATDAPDAGASLHTLERVFIVYALARTGAYDPAYAGKLYEQRAELPPFVRLELAHALTKDPERRALVDALLSELTPHVRVTAEEAHVETNRGDGYDLAFVSDVRASAELLLLLLDHAPQHVLVPKLARWLSSARSRDGTWMSTQETAWAVMALATYLEVKESVTPDMRAQVQLGDRDVLGPVALSGHRAQAQFHVPMRDAPLHGAAVSFDKKGAGTLYYALRLVYADAALPTQPSERGFFVERSYERITPGAMAGGDYTGVVSDTAHVGDYVRITLRVAVPSARRFVMIEDPLPAGLEPVDFTLSSEFSGAARALSSAAPLDHQELRDDRAVFAINDLPPGLYRYTYLARASHRGRFVAPAARVSEMYHPETHGTTAARSFTVDAP